MNTFTKLKFQAGGNAKLGRETYTFALPAGSTCPGALDCLAWVDPDTRRIKDGRHQIFRCFAASQEVAFPTVFAARLHNWVELRKAATREAMTQLILDSLPESAVKVRVHDSGDFFSQAYFDAWMAAAEARPQTIFYAYTKSISFWIKRLLEIPENFRLNASLGGKQDHLVLRLDLKRVQVVFHPEEAEKIGIPIDHDDSLASENTVQEFALLLHGGQPKDSTAGAALKRLKTEGVDFAYSSKKPRPQTTHA